MILRADELAEFLSLYAHANGVKPDALKKVLSNQVRKGLARAFQKFSAYQLGKYNRDNPIKLRDVLFLCHARPKDTEQQETWAKLINGTLESPDTWEVALSGGADKKETFERLIREECLGYLALLRNLRNMEQAGCDADLVRNALIARKGAHNVLPFRYVAAYMNTTIYQEALDQAFFAALESVPELEGTTVLLIDVSGSMDDPLSKRSDMKRYHAANSLAVMIRTTAKKYVITFSERLAEVGWEKASLSLIERIRSSQPNIGTRLAQAAQAILAKADDFDRLIVITDEQMSYGKLPGAVGKKCYMINVAPNKNGVGYTNGWTHIDGFSESVIRYIAAVEGADRSPELLPAA